MSKTISLQCRCGAKIELTDSEGRWINNGGKPDEKGRVYVIDVQADGWLDRHSGCLNVRTDFPPISKENDR